MATNSLDSLIKAYILGRATMTSYTTLYQRGLSLSGLEYSASTFPGVEGTNFFAPKEADFKYFSSKGLYIVRLPFLWERLQPELYGDLDATFKGYIDQAIAYAVKYRMKILLDVHNYGGRYVDGVHYKIGTANLPIGAFADFWGRVASAYARESGIFGFDLMNEPIDLPLVASEGTYNPNVSTKLQLINNPSFEGGTDTWAVDGTFSRTSEDAYVGSYSIKQAGTAGNYDNFTTQNDATGIAVKPNTTYTLSFATRLAITSGKAPYLQVKTGSAFGTTLTSMTVPESTEWTRNSLTFTTDANTEKVWLRIGNNGGAVNAFYDAFNLTPGSTLEDYRDYTSTGEVCTSTLMHNAAIQAIRGAGAEQWIIMETDRYSGLSVFSTNYGSNPDIWWADPLNKTMLSFHYYLDPDRSGSYAKEWTQACRDRLESEVRAVFDWCKKNDVKIFMGEYGVPVDASESSANYRTDLDTFMSLMDEYNAYGTYWAAGVNYSSPPNCNPTDNYTTDASTMAIITAHLGKTEVATDPVEEVIPENVVTYNGVPVKSGDSYVIYTDETQLAPDNAITYNGALVTYGGKTVVQTANESAPDGVLTYNGAYVTSDDAYVTYEGVTPEGAVTYNGSYVTYDAAYVTA